MATPTTRAAHTAGHKVKILAAIQSRGWFTVEIYAAAAQELEDAGLIKRSDRYFTGGNIKPVWVAA